MVRNCSEEVKWSYLVRVELSPSLHSQLFMLVHTLFIADLMLFFFFLRFLVCQKYTMRISRNLPA